MSENLPQITLVLSLLSLLLGGYLFWQFRSLNRLRKIFFTGQQNLDWEQVLEVLTRDLQTSRQENAALSQQLQQLQANFYFAVQKIGVVRFNPFNDAGGNFSFALALLDGHDNGVVLTSMHGREQNRIYTKSVRQGRGEIQLTAEELKAIQLACKL